MGSGAATPGMTSDRRAQLPDATALGRGRVEAHDIVTVFGTSIASALAMDSEPSPMLASHARSGVLSRARGRCDQAG